MVDHSSDEPSKKGRRADAPRDKRGTVLTLRVSEAEAQRIRRVAARHGITPSALLRAAALDMDEDGRIPSSVRPVAAEEVVTISPELNDLRVQVKGAAANINQIARIANTERAVPLTADEDLQTVTDLLVETRDLCRQVLTNLGARGHG